MTQRNTHCSSCCCVVLLPGPLMPPVHLVLREEVQVNHIHQVSISDEGKVGEEHVV